MGDENENEFSFVIRGERESSIWSETIRRRSNEILEEGWLFGDPLLMKRVNYREDFCSKIEASLRPFWWGREDWQDFFCWTVSRFDPERDWFDVELCAPTTKLRPSFRWWPLTRHCVFGASVASAHSDCVPVVVELRKSYTLTFKSGMTVIRQS